VKKIDGLGNNLAHGNFSWPIKDVKHQIKNYLEEFKTPTRI